MRVVITNKDKAKAFTSMFQNMKLFCEHINLMFEPGRLYAQGMDSSHISVFEIFIPSTWFDEYVQEGTSVIGLSTQHLFRILNTREESQQISIMTRTPTSYFCISSVQKRRSTSILSFHLSNWNPK